MYLRLASLLIALSVLAPCLSQQASSTDDKSSIHCHALSRDNYTCAHCIQLHPSCAWCTKPQFENRCDTLERLQQFGCTGGFVQNPKGKKPIIIRNQALSDAGTASETNAIQLKPQEIEVFLRPKERVEFNLTFKQALDYPVDLYYLMDLSFSMVDDKDKLTKLGDALANRMRSITKNFRLGFGSFVDKAVMPWVDARPEKANKPCPECVAPYGYRHHMKLTDNTAEFKHLVNASKVSGNLDAPEGGFDAIMQALVCEELIGWREGAKGQRPSRRILVYSSDAGFHYAGDGRLAGIVVPNDGACHMEKKSDGSEYEYSMSKEQDYPSVSQLHHIIATKKANVIFAVTESQVPLYRRLHEALTDVSTTVGKLAEDSSNVVELVADEYKKISQKLVMKDNSGETEGSLKLTYFTSCLGKSEVENNTCDGIKVSDQVTFRIQLDALKCSSKRDFTLNIGPAGLSDSMVLKVHVLCGCDCEKPGSQGGPLVNSVECSSRGSLTCGECQCRDHYIGRKCECDTPGFSTVQMEARCRKNNNTLDGALCEGRGQCECGVCVCDKRKFPEQVTGRHCECDNFNCPRHNKQLCNGRGTCDCQACQCEPGWGGQACECPHAITSCMAANGKLCNGRGECTCGVCKCYRDADGVRFSGPTCDICPTCPDKCVEYKDCVLCQQFKTGKYNASQCAACPFRVNPVKELPTQNENNKTLVACQFVDPADDCTFHFAYDLDEGLGTMTVWVKEEKKCPEPVPVLAIVLGVIAAIVLIGLLLLLIWKVLTVLHDRREYAKFEQERMNSRFPAGENPLFHPATSTYLNPSYNGKKHA